LQGAVYLREDKIGITVYLLYINNILDPIHSEWATDIPTKTGNTHGGFSSTVIYMELNGAEPYLA
jgi:hypothetical protein